VKVDKILKVCRVSPSKTVGGLSDRQRAELASMMRSLRLPVLVQRPRGTDQHLRALELANDCRLARSD
jgi:hypothetical protein